MFFMWWDFIELNHYFPSASDELSMKVTRITKGTQVRMFGWVRTAGLLQEEPLNSCMAICGAIKAGQ